MSNFPTTLSLNNKIIEKVNSFVYLGSTFVMDESSNTTDILSRIGKATSTFGRLKSQLFTRADISIKTKMRVFNCSVIPVLLYGSESWLISAIDMKRLEVADALATMYIECVSPRPSKKHHDPREMLSATTDLRPDTEKSSTVVWPYV